MPPTPHPRPRRLLLATGAGAAVLALAAPAAHALRTFAFFGAETTVAGDTVTVQDFAPDLGSRSSSIAVGPAAADGTRVISYFYPRSDTTPREPFFPVGPGCTLLSATDVTARVSCAATGVTRLAVRPRAGSPVNLHLGVEGSDSPLPAFPLQVQADLGAGEDLYGVGANFANDVDGGAGVDSLRLTPVLRNPLDGASGKRPFTYSDDGVANDGYEGLPVQNLRGFEELTAFGTTNVTASGGAAANLFRTELGNDTLRGGDGDDDLRGGAMNDVLEGGAGDDLLVGRTDPSGTVAPLGTLDGAPQTDVDRIDGGPGNDTIVGNEGVDTVTGGAGDDRLLLRDGNADVVRCDPGANTYDIDLKDDLGGVQDCTAGSGARSEVGTAATQLDLAIRSGKIASQNGAFTTATFPKPPVSPQFASGAVREKPNVVVARQVLVARKGVARVRLTCPARTATGCAGTVELQGLNGRRLARAAAPHRIRAGATATVRVPLGAGLRRTPGARLVLVRVAERGVLGPKTSGIVLPLAVPRG